MLKLMGCLGDSDCKILGLKSIKLEKCSASEKVHLEKCEKVHLEKCSALMMINPNDTDPN